MTINNSKVFQLENCLYLAADENNVPHFYNRNPMKISDEDELSACETSIHAEIAEFIPGSDVHHPVAIQIRFRALRDAQPFMPDKVDAIRAGRIDCHIEDLGGEIISILPEPVRYGEYNIGGQVLNPSTGEVTELRLYNSKGECFDGNREHTLEIIGGKVIFNNAEKSDREDGGEGGRDEQESGGDYKDIQDEDLLGTMAVIEKSGFEVVPDDKPEIRKGHSETFKSYFRTLRVRNNGQAEKIEEFKYD